MVVCATSPHPASLESKDERRAFHTHTQSVMGGNVRARGQSWVGTVLFCFPAQIFETESPSELKLPTLARPVRPQDLPVAASPMLGLQACTIMSKILVGTRALNLGPYACMVHILPVPRLLTRM